MNLPSAITTLILLLSSLCVPLLAQPAPILHRIDDHYNHLTSLTAHYQEHFTGLGMDRSEQGTLLLKKPGRMRWSYAEPAGKVFVLDGKYAWFYTPGDAQAQRIPAKQLDDLRSPLRYLLGHTQLSKELDNITVTPTPTGFTVAGIPKGMAQRVKSLTLTVNSAGAIQQMRLEELDGATTEFTFTDLHENVSVKDSDFTFTPPPGVAIVDGPRPHLAPRNFVILTLSAAEGEESPYFVFAVVSLIPP